MMAGQIVRVHQAGLFADEPEVMSARDAARLLGVNVKTIYREVAAGRLQSFHVGSALRIKRAALVEYVEGCNG